MVIAVARGSEQVIFDELPDASVQVNEPLLVEFGDDLLSILALDEISRYLALPAGDALLV